MEKNKPKTEEMHLLNFNISKKDFYRLNLYCTEKGCITFSSVLRELISKKLDKEGIKNQGDSNGVSA